MSCGVSCCSSSARARALHAGQQRAVFQLMNGTFRHHLHALQPNALFAQRHFARKAACRNRARVVAQAREPQQAFAQSRSLQHETSVGIAHRASHKNRIGQREQHHIGVRHSPMRLIRHFSRQAVRPDACTDAVCKNHSFHHRIFLFSLRFIIPSAVGNTYPTGLASSEPPTARILQDWHRPSLRQHKSCRIGIIRASDSTYPAGLASSELPTALILQDWQDWHRPSLRQCLSGWNSLQSNGKTSRRRKIILTRGLRLYYYFITPRHSSGFFRYLCRAQSNIRL